MEIERILKLRTFVDTEKELLEMIISNHIDHYLGDKKGAAVSHQNFSSLADDILKWHEDKTAQKTKETAGKGAMK